MSQTFFHSYRNQSFPFPDTIIYYITKTPSNPRGYQKLIQSCKYFFCKNPILVFHCLFFKNGEFQTCLTDKRCLEEYKKVNFNNTVAKIWIIDTLSIIPVYLNASFTSTFIQKLYKYDKISALILQSQMISIDEVLLPSSIINLYLYQTSIRSTKNGPLISIPKIMDSLPHVKLFFFAFNEDNASIFTRNTVKEILEIRHFRQLDHFTLLNIPETFDIQTFYEYLKTNKNTDYNLIFCNTISQEYRNRLETIVDEIIAIKFHKYKVPYIVYQGMHADKKRKLKVLSYTALYCY